MNYNNNMNLNNLMNMNNINTMNPMMLNQDDNNMPQNELIKNLLIQNNQMANQIEINNNIIKSSLQKPKLEKISLFDLTKNIDFFPAYEGKKINIIFTNDSIKPINIVAPIGCKIKELLSVFHIKLQMFGKDNNIKIWDLKDYIFIYNGHIMSLNEEKTINDFCSHEVEKIIFKLKSEVIGG